MKFFFLFFLIASAQATIRPDVVIGAIYCETFGETPSMGFVKGSKVSPQLTSLYKSHVDLFRAGGIGLADILIDVKAYERTAGANGAKASGNTCGSVRSDKSILENYNLLMRTYCESLGIEKKDTDLNFIDRLWKLYSGQSSIEEIRESFAQLKSTTRSEASCSSYTDIKAEKSLKEVNSDLFNYDFVSVEDVNSPNNIYVPNYKGKPYCEQKGQGSWERFELKAKFNDEFYSKLVDCGNQAMQGEEKVCFGIELKVKAMKRECQRSKGDQTKCLSNADLWGNLELDKNSCGRKIDWAGIHHARELTDPGLDQICNINNYDPSIIVTDSFINSSLREKPYAKNYIKHNQCIIQACYDTQKKYFSLSLKFENNYAKKCKTGYPYERECTANPIAFHAKEPPPLCPGEKEYNMQCVYTFPIAAENGKAPIFLKDRIENERQWAEKFKGRYINNQVFEQFDPQGKSLSTTAWYVFSLNGNANYIKGGYRVYVNCGSNQFKPEVDDEGQLVYKDKSKGQISWIDGDKDSNLKTILETNSMSMKGTAEQSQVITRVKKSNSSEFENIIENAKMKDRAASPVGQTICNSSIAKDIISELYLEMASLTADLRKQAIQTNCWENNKISMNSPDCDHFKAKDIVMNLSLRKKDILNEYQEKYKKLASDNKACAGEYRSLEEELQSKSQN